MRLVLMGTGPFGLPAFRRLYEGRHEIVAVVTAPLRPPKGRGPAPAHPVRDLAAAHGTPVLAPEDVNEEAARSALGRCQADLLVVCDYGQILSAETLATARLGGVNLHGSLLPRYRGAAPIHWAIYHGETETGVSVIHMTPKVDAGPVIAQRRTPIGDEETAEDVEPRLAALGGDLVPEAIDALEAGRAEEIAQDAALVSKAPRLRKAHGLIDWIRPAAAVKNQIRAMQPWPKAYTFWHRAESEPLRLVIGPVAVDPEGDPSAAPGTVLEASGDRFRVAAGRGSCLLGSVQPAGKRVLSAEAFLRGYRVRGGDVLGGPSA